MTENAEYLLNHEEGQFLERKSCYALGVSRRWQPLAPRQLARIVAEALAGFANADGGTLVVGVQEAAGQPWGLEGYGEDRMKVILSAPRTHVVPPLSGVRQTWIEVCAHRLLVFEVGPSMEVHQLTDGRYVMRQADATVPFSAQDIEAIKAARRRQAAESEFIGEAGLADLDPALLAAFRDRVGLAMPDDELLVRYRLADRRNGRLVFRLAALLLFGSDPLRWHPTCHVDFVKWEGTDRRVGAELNVVRRERIEGPLPSLIEDTFQTVQPHIRERQQLVDLFFEERFEYPTFAWQEAIVNAVAHRDYALRGTPVEVGLFDDHMEVRSPGPPIEPVTMETLQRGTPIHASRNPLVARVLTEWGYMRELGEGIPRMFQVMQQEGLRPPDFRLDADAIFSLSLYNTLVYPPETLGWLRQFQDQGLSRNQLRLLAYAHAHGGTFTSRQYQQLTGVDIYAAQQDIRQLRSQGIAVLPKKGSRVYSLVEEPGEEVASELREQFKRVQPAIEEKGFVTNADVRRLLDVDRTRATRLLRQWTEARMLAREGKGRGTRYWPGGENASL
ncbi:MAG: ATP-binding protein [Armatimonadota bacterium]